MGFLFFRYRFVSNSSKYLTIGVEFLDSVSPATIPVFLDIAFRNIRAQVIINPVLSLSILFGIDALQRDVSFLYVYVLN